MLGEGAEDAKEPPFPESLDVADANENEGPIVSKESGPLFAGDAEDVEEPPVP